MKILINALSGIGDALMFTPALLKLKEIIPESQIDALVMFKGVRDIYSRIDVISKTHYYDFLNSSRFEALKFILKLRNEYDASFNIYPSNRLEYNIINFLIGAKTKAAIKYLRRDLRNFSFLNNLLINENDELHNVEENIRIIEKLTKTRIEKIPPLFFPLNKDDLEFADRFINEKNITGDFTIIGFHPGCAILKNHIKRRWEPEKFIQLGKKILEIYDSRILIFGGPDEKELKEEIVTGIDNDKVIAVNTDNLAKTAAVMKRCNVFISNDSALMHVAAALQLNIVSIIGPTNINYISPWQTNFKLASLNLDCSPCFYYSPKPLTCSRNDVKFKCIRELSAELVFDKIKEFLLN